MPYLMKHGKCNPLFRGRTVSQYQSIVRSKTGSSRHNHKVHLCSMFPKSTHETFAQKMYQTYKGHKRFSKPKLAQTAFTVNHYAGDVRQTQF